MFVFIVYLISTLLYNGYEGLTMAYNPENPACPKCGSPMRGYEVKNAMHWVCTRNPDCDGVIRVTLKQNRKQPPSSLKA
jgi:DNA topoisomerase-3